MMSMQKCFLASAVALVILSSTCSTFVAAQWKCSAETTAEICKAAGQSPAKPADGSAVGRCPKTYFLSNTLGDVKEQFNQCADDGATCCTDPCTLQLDIEGCMSLMLEDGNTPRCAYMPYSGSRFNCVSKWKLCLLNKNVADCQRNVMCEMNNKTTPKMCSVKAKFEAEDVAASANLDECPALHGVVVAFLVLMFISLVGAIVFVVVVVIYKQKKADEEERLAKAEQEAAEAAAKAAQGEAEDF